MFPFPDQIDIKIVSVTPWMKPVPGEVIAILSEKEAWKKVEKFGGDAYCYRYDGTLSYVTRHGPYTLGFRRNHSLIEPQVKRGWMIHIEINGQPLSAFVEGPDMPSQREIYVLARDYVIRQFKERTFR